MKRTETVTDTNMCMIYDENGNGIVQERVKEWPGVAFPGGKYAERQMYNIDRTFVIQQMY